MIFVVVVACEIGFWVLLAAGLFSRYVLRRRRLGAVLLLSVPLVDVVLLVASVVDLRGGAEAGVEHGLSAAYLGFSVGFGHSVVRWADGWVAYRFARGPRPAKPPRAAGWERARFEWREFGKAAVAWAVSCGLLGVMILLVGSGSGPAGTSELTAWVARLSVVLAIWFVGWPVVETFRAAAANTVSGGSSRPSASGADRAGGAAKRRLPSR